jgi:hypothetical protein
MVTWNYEGGGLRLHAPSRNTGRAVHGYGEPKGLMPVSEGKPKSAQPMKVGKALGLKGPEVIAVRLETWRSSPGQGEVRRKPGGGLKQF